MTRLITIDKEHYDDLVKAKESFDKLKESATEKVALWHSQYAGMGHYRQEIYVFDKDEAFSRLTKELELCNESINEKVDMIRDLKAIDLPMFNFTNRTVDDIYKKKK